MKATRTADLVFQLVPRILAACEAPLRKPGAAVTTALARVLDRLDPGVPVTVTELAARLGVSPSTASLSVDRLEKLGLAYRERDRYDGRRVLVGLTEAGEEARERTGPLDRKAVGVLVERLSPGRRRKALRGLKALAEAADAIQGERVRSRSWGRRRPVWTPPPPVPGVEGDSPP
jgi:DNA-binding MarR family transcriptional regulator